MYSKDGVANTWIENLLSNRSQSVLVEGACSSSIPVISGVPQGSVLGPCLFLFYISDIADSLFADDTMIYLAVTNEQDARIFQEDLDKLTTWEKRWMVEFYPDKCEVITISRKRNSEQCTIR